MKAKNIEVLMVEDDPGDADLTQELLEEAKIMVNVNVVTDGEKAIAYLRHQPPYTQAVRPDLSLPDSHGLQTFIQLYAHAPHLPIVVLSGSGAESVAIKALQEGAQDYLVKGEASSKLIVRALRYAIERKHVQIALQESEERLKHDALHESLTASIQAQATQDVGYALVNENLIIVTNNSLMTTWSALPITQLEGQSLTKVLPELVGMEKTLHTLLQKTGDEAINIPRIYRQIHRSATDTFGRYFDLRVETFQAAEATLLVIISDVTEKARLEFTLRQERNELRLLMAKYKEIAQELGELTVHHDQIR